MSAVTWKFTLGALTVVVVVVVVVVIVVVVVVIVVVVVVVVVVRRRRRRRRGRNIIEFAKLMEYVDGKEDPLIQIVRTH